MLDIQLLVIVDSTIRPLKRTLRGWWAVPTLLDALELLHAGAVSGGLLLTLFFGHTVAWLGGGGFICVVILLGFFDFLGLGLEGFVAGNETLLFHTGDHLAGVLGFIDGLFFGDFASVEVHPQVVIEQLHAV